MDYNAHISKLFPGLTPVAQLEEDNRLWNAWLDLGVGGTRKTEDLVALLASDVREGFKVRALIVLFAPDGRILPFRWNHTIGSFAHYFFSPGLSIDIIPDTLVNFAGQLICTNIDYVLRETHNQQLRETLHWYNKVIRDFLEVLPVIDKLAGQMFDRYQINDPSAYTNADDASGYNPFLSILITPNIPVVWKLQADRLMQAQILAEVKGDKQPRADWEDALTCYTRHIQIVVNSGLDRYPCELLVSHIYFITNLPCIEEYANKLFNDWNVAHILDLLTGDTNRKTRHKFARLIVLSTRTERPGFLVTRDESRRAADMMLAEFGAEDSELALKLRCLIAEADARESGREEAERSQQEQLEKVLSQMKQ